MPNWTWPGASPYYPNVFESPWPVRCQVAPPSFLGGADLEITLVRWIRLATLLDRHVQKVGQHRFHEPAHFRVVHDNERQGAIGAAKDHLAILPFRGAESAPLPEERDGLGDPVREAGRLDCRAILRSQAMTNGTRPVVQLLGRQTFGQLVHEVPQDRPINLGEKTLRLRR